MKGSTVLWIAGGVIIAGVAVYGTHKYLQHQKGKTTESTDVPTATPDGIIIPDVASDNPQHGRIVTEFEQVQQDAATSIRKRHQATTQQLRETLGEMSEDPAEFEERITQINDDLDKLLE